jgi:hypothetical protein
MLIKLINKYKHNLQNNKSHNFQKEIVVFLLLFLLVYAMLALSSFSKAFCLNCES